MGEVYRATDTRLDRTVAIKVLPEHLASDPQRRERFEREARAVSSLNHPHICTLYDVGEQDGVHFLVMELVEGDTLQQRLEKGRLPLDQALEYAIQIADALDKAHRQGVVHRDLKPGNIMITKSAGVKLLDFGLAKLKGDAAQVSPLSQMPTQDPSAPLTAEGTIIGTLQYMAPEQLEGKEADARTDIFAFGVVAYEMVTGKKAFEGASQASLIHAIMGVDPPSMSELQAMTPPTLDRVVRTCLGKDPDDRWQTSSDLMRELKWISEDHRHPPTVGSLGSSEQDKPQSPIRLPAFMLVAIGVLMTLGLVGAATVMGWLSSAQSTDQRSLVQRQLTANQAERAVMGAAISPDGTYLAYRDPTGLYLQVIETGAVNAVSLSEDLLFGELDWFPDGTRLVAEGWSPLNYQRSLYSIPIIGGTPRRLRDGWRPAVSPNGNLIAFLTPDNHEVWTMGENGENPTPLVMAGPGEGFWQVTWSPDGRHVVLGKSAPGGLHSIESINLEDQTRTMLVSDSRLFVNWRAILPIVWLPDNRLVYGRQEPPPNTSSSNLWAVSIDPNTGTPTGSAEQISEWSGFHVRSIRATMDGRTLTLLRENFQVDVHVAEIGPEGRTIGATSKLTFDDREDYPRGDWTRDSQAVLFESNRGNGTDILKQHLGSQVPRSLDLKLWERKSSTTEPGRHLGLVSAIGSTESVLGHHADTGVRGASETVFMGTNQQTDFYCGKESCLLGEISGSELVLRELDPVAGPGSELKRLDLAAGDADFGFVSWALSPDGRRVAVTTFRDRVRIIELANDGDDELRLEGWIKLNQVAWSSDGEAVYLDATHEDGPLVANNSLIRMELDGTVHVLRERLNDMHIFPMASPDGRYLGACRE